MKKNFLYIVLLSILVLAGCSKQNQMPDYIPTTVNGAEAGDSDGTKTPGAGDASGDTAEADDAGVSDGSDASDNTDASDAAGTSGDTGETGASEDGDGTADGTPVHVGQTTTKYVKLGEYDAVLNVRETPSKDGKIVGFLVHTEKIDVIEITDGWASFVYNGAVSYTSADFLVDERPAYIEPPTSTPKPTNTPKPTSTPAPTNSPTPEEDQELPPEI